MKAIQRRFGGHSLEATIRIEKARRGLGEVSQAEITQLDAIAAEFFRARRRLGLTGLDMSSPRNRAAIEAEVRR